MENKIRNWCALLLLATVTTNCLAIALKKHTNHAMPQIYKTSFNCYRASTKTELAICHSKELAGADIVLSALYYQQVDKQPADFAIQQKKWLRERDFCSKSFDIVHCLLKKYQDRIGQLKDLKNPVQLKQEYAAAPSKNVEVERLEKMNHPVLSVLKKHNMSLYKVSYSKNGTCPTFYVKFKFYPLSTENDAYSKKAYDEILKANSSFPYAIVDEDNNYKVNVGFEDKAKTVSLVRPADVSSPSTCLDGSSSD